MAAPIYAGVRILEFGSNPSGATATRFFAEHGATVIRIEGKPPPDHGEPDPAGMPFAAGRHRIVIDLTTDDGLALALRLVERADVVVDGLGPGALARLGLAPERLLLRKPDLILVSVSLFGQTGPQRDARGDDPEAAAIAGFSHLTGWSDRPPQPVGDPRSPRYVALLVAAALLARRRSGRGQHIEVSQAEVGVYSLADWLVREAAGHERGMRAGNRDDTAAPHGIYPCRGEDTWIALSVSDDEEWDSLLAAMGDPEWATQLRFAKAASRRRHADELDAGIAAWTRDFAPFELMAGLQAAGVPAGVVQHDAALRRDPQLAHRGHFARVVRASHGSSLVERAGFRIAGAADGFESTRESGDGDTEVVLSTLLDLSPREVAALRASGTVA
jgi:benzylsuccinate CoA-transferase BbsF subunit